jgi:phage terminase large subunit-like protein
VPAQLSQSDLVDWFTSRGGPWRQVARANQLAPQRDDWDTWLLCAGRGFGKTRTGAEWTIEEAIMNPGSRGALIAPTAADCRDIMVRGESGILACAPPGLVDYSPSNRLVTFTNGSTLTLYSAEEPDRLRGPQHHFAWCDELASWRRMRDTWDMMQMGLRLGAHPRTCVTTTPRPLPLVKELIKHPRSHITTGTTYDNIHNLAPTFRQMIEDRYEGTTLGRQELYAEILSDLPGAMVAMSIIEQHRVSLPPELDSVAVALDPAGTGKGDESGIVAVGKAGKDLYVLADKSGRMTPRESARAAWNLVEELDADVLVYEDNLGKAWIEEVLMGVWKESRDPHQMPALRRVTATVGKKLRAAPVTARYEQGRVHHVGVLGDLEDQLTSWIPEEDPSKSPDRIDAMVHAATHFLRKERSMGRMASPPTSWPGRIPSVPNLGIAGR